MRVYKSFLSLSVILGLSACASFDGNNEIETLKMAQAAGSPFTQQLTSEYRAFSSFELDTESDYADALHFARKGLSAAEGINVMPEPVNDWDLTAADILELSNAYARLTNAYSKGAREILPGKSAIAQARYDCWIEEQEEIAKGTETSTVPCKADFMKIMDEIEAALPAQVVDVVEEFPQPVTMIDTSEPLNVQEALYLVFFDFDSSLVNQGGLEVIDAVVAEVQSRQLNAIDIVGHTDTSGSQSYNEKLALRRGNAIKSKLASMGIPANMINVSAQGESNLLVQTQDNIREPANRRAVITFR